MTDAFARVALPLPLHNGYLYRIPEPLRGSVEPGMRAVVPVRGRELIGVVVGLEADPPPVRALDLLAVPDREPLLTAPLLATAEWVAGYYGAPLGLALRAALPAAMWGESRVIMRLHRCVAGGGRGRQRAGAVAGSASGWRNGCGRVAGTRQAGVGDGVAPRGSRRARPGDRSARHRREAGERAAARARGSRAGIARARRPVPPEPEAATAPRTARDAGRHRRGEGTTGARRNQRCGDEGPRGSWPRAGGCGGADP